MIVEILVLRLAYGICTSDSLPTNPRQTNLIMAHIFHLSKLRSDFIPAATDFDGTSAFETAFVQKRVSLPNPALAKAAVQFHCDSPQNVDPILSADSLLWFSQLFTVFSCWSFLQRHRNLNEKAHIIFKLGSIKTLKLWYYETDCDIREFVFLTIN